MQAGERRSHRTADQGLAVGFIGGGFADDGIQRRLVWVARDLCAHDPVEKTAHADSTVRDAVLAAIVGHVVHDLHHLGNLVFVGGSGDAHGALHHDLGRGQLNVLHQTHSVDDRLVKAAAALIGDVRRDDHHRVGMPLDDFAGAEADDIAVLGILEGCAVVEASGDHGIGCGKT